MNDQFSLLHSPLMSSCSCWRKMSRLAPPHIQRLWFQLGTSVFVLGLFPVPLRKYSTHSILGPPVNTHHPRSQPQLSLHCGSRVFSWEPKVHIKNV